MNEIPERYFVEGVPFWISPKIYRFGYTQFDEREHARYLDDFGFTIREDQFRSTDAEQLIEAAGRGCYLSYEPEVKGRATDAYLDNIKVSNHGSVVRHASITLNICGVSRGLTHELVRHGVGTAISQTSSRYIAPRRLGFVVPPLLRDGAGEQGLFVDECLFALEKSEDCFKRLKKKGVLTKPARGAARESLPIGLAQKIAFTFNVQSYRHILRMRGSEHAETQIRELAMLMAPIAKEMWPNLCDDVENVVNSKARYVQLDDEI